MKMQIAVLFLVHVGWEHDTKEPVKAYSDVDHAKAIENEINAISLQYRNANERETALEVLNRILVREGITNPFNDDPAKSRSIPDAFVKLVPLDDSNVSDV